MSSNHAHSHYLLIDDFFMRRNGISSITMIRAGAKFGLSVILIAKNCIRFNSEYFVFIIVVVLFFTTTFVLLVNIAFQK